MIEEDPTDSLLASPPPKISNYTAVQLQSDEQNLPPQPPIANRFVVDDSSNDENPGLLSEPTSQPSSQTNSSPQENDETESQGPSSSLSNALPVDKLKNGWAFLSTWAMTTAAAAREKAIEINNSEQTQQYKRKLSESAATAWQKAVETTEKAKIISTPYIEKANETAAPILQQTKEGIAVVVEKTKVVAADAAEKAKPYVEAVSKVMTEKYQEFTGSTTEANKGTIPQSALDVNSQGRSFTV